MKYDKGSFTVVPCIDKLKGKNPILQATYMWICNYSNQEGFCFPSQATLANNVGVSLNALKKYLKELEDDGFIQVTRRVANGEKQTSIYQLVIGQAPDAQPQAPDAQGGRAPNAYRTISTSLTKTTKQYFENEIINELFIKFIEMRRKIKKPMTDYAIELMIKKLNKYKDEIKIKMLEKSLVNSWSDVYEIKGQEINNTIESLAEEYEFICNRDGRSGVFKNKYGPEIRSLMQRYINAKTNKSPSLESIRNELNILIKALDNK